MYTVRSIRLQLQLVNVTLVVPNDELQFLTASFGPNATANSSGWVTTPSAGLGRMDPAPVRERDGAGSGVGRSVWSLRKRRVRVFE